MGRGTPDAAAVTVRAVRGWAAKMSNAPKCELELDARRRPTH